MAFSREICLSQLAPHLVIIYYTDNAVSYQGIVQISKLTDFSLVFKSIT